MSEGLRLSAYVTPKVIWPVCNGPTTVQIESFARGMSDDLRHAYTVRKVCTKCRSCEEQRYDRHLCRRS